MSFLVVTQKPDANTGVDMEVGNFIAKDNRASIYNVGVASDPQHQMHCTLINYRPPSEENNIQTGRGTCRRCLLWRADDSAQGPCCVYS